MDDIWFAQLKEEDNAAWEQLWVKLMTWGVTSAKKRGQSEDLGRDAAIKSFEIIQRKLDTVKDPNKLSGFCRVIVVREVLHLLKKKKVSEVEWPEEFEFASEGKEHDLGDDELFAQLEVCNQQLKDPKDKVVKLHYFSGKKLREIDELLEFHPGNAKVILHRARTDLKDCLGKNGYSADFFNL